MQRGPGRCGDAHVPPLNDSERTQRKQRLENARRQMAKAEGFFDLEVNTARIAPAPLYDPLLSSHQRQLALIQSPVVYFAVFNGYQLHSPTSCALRR